MIIKKEKKPEIHAFVSKEAKYTISQVGGGNITKGLERIAAYVKDVGFRKFMRELKERKIIE